VHLSAKVPFAGAVAIGECSKQRVVKPPEPAEVRRHHHCSRAIPAGAPAITTAVAQAPVGTRGLAAACRLRFPWRAGRNEAETVQRLNEREVAEMHVSQPALPAACRGDVARRDIARLEQPPAKNNRIVWQVGA